MTRVPFGSGRIWWNPCNSIGSTGVPPLVLPKGEVTPTDFVSCTINYPATGGIAMYLHSARGTLVLLEPNLRIPKNFSRNRVILSISRRLSR